MSEHEWWNEMAVAAEELIDLLVEIGLSPDQITRLTATLREITITQR